MSDVKGDSSETISIPVVAEQLRIDRREVVTGGVRVRKQVIEGTETVDEPLSASTVEVEHVAVGRFVDAVPEVRLEGDLTIVPVVEEVAVVQKRLWLREEVHIRRRWVETRSPQVVTLQRETVTVERISAAEADAHQAAQGGLSGTANAFTGRDGSSPARQRDEQPE